MKITNEAVQALEEESRIDALRIQAFKTNANSDRQAYFDAVSKWFQGRHDRSAALPHLQNGYRIKQLEWAEGGKGLAVRKFFSTNRMYSITENHGGSFIVETDNSSRSLGSKGNLKAAKELAQADFERRVRECIVGGVDVTSLDLSVLETLSEKADEFDIPDELGPWPDIQDAMITVGDLRKVRRLLKDFQSLSATPTEMAEVRRQALEEEEFALKVAEEMIVARDRRIKELEGQLIKKTEECAVLANSLDKSAAPTEEEEL